MSAITLLPSILRDSQAVATEESPQENNHAKHRTSCSASSRYVYANHRLPKPSAKERGPSLFRRKARETSPTPATHANSEAENFSQLGDQMVEKKKYDKAIEAYQKAMQADPKDLNIEFKLAQALVENGNPMAALQVCGDILGKDPKAHPARSFRAQIEKMILDQLSSEFESLDDEKKQLFSQLSMESLKDQTVLIAFNSAQGLEGLKKVEEQLKSNHSKTAEEKLQILEGLEQQTDKGAQLALQEFSNPKDQAYIQEQLNRYNIGVFKMLARFAKEDLDPSINRLAPLYVAYQNERLENSEAAEKAYAIVAAEAYKLFGGGDAAKGKEKLIPLIEKHDTLMKKATGIFQQVEALFKSGKQEDAQKKLEEAQAMMEEGMKLYADVPKGLVDAHKFLEATATFKKQKIMVANMAVLEIWENQEKAYWSKSVDERLDLSNYFWKGPSRAWDVSLGLLFRGIAGMGVFDEINREVDVEHSLILAIRTRLEKGTSKTVQEALKFISEEKLEEKKAPDKESDDQNAARLYEEKIKPKMKARAAEIIAEGEKVDTKLGFSLGQIISFVAPYPFDTKKEKPLLAVAEAMAKAGAYQSNKAATAQLYALLVGMGEDTEVKQKAMAYLSPKKTAAAAPSQPDLESLMAQQ